MYPIQRAQGKLGQEDQGHAPDEVPMFCLVTKGVHPQDSPQAAAQEGGEEEDLLRDPARSGALGPALGRDHMRKKAGEVDQEQIARQPGPEGAHKAPDPCPRRPPADTGPFMSAQLHQLRGGPGGQTGE